MIFLSHYPVYFRLDNNADKQNRRDWGFENPRISIEQQLHSQKITLWYGLCYEGFTGSFCFEHNN